MYLPKALWLQRSKQKIVQSSYITTVTKCRPKHPLDVMMPKKVHGIHIPFNCTALCAYVNVKCSCVWQSLYSLLYSISTVGLGQYIDKINIWKADTCIHMIYEISIREKKIPTVPILTSLLLQLFNFNQWEFTLSYR